MRCALFERDLWRGAVGDLRYCFPVGSISLYGEE